MNDLSVTAKKRFNELVSTIDKWHNRTISDIWPAFIELRENRGYLETHKTFEAFCQDRWGYGRNYVNKIIQSGEVVSGLGTMVPKVAEALKTERQIRELVNVNDDDMPTVAEKLEEKLNAGEKLTAKVVKQVVADVVLPPAEPPANENDPVENASFCTQIKTKINEALKLLREVPEVDGTQYLVQRERSIRSKLESAKDEVVSATPDRLCGKCNGKKCVQCGNMGWVTARM